MTPKRSFAAVSALLVALLLPAAGRAEAPARAPKYKIRWLITHQNLDYFNAAAKAFKTRVERGSAGEIEVVIETSNPGTQSSEAVAAERIARRVAAGEAQMGHTFTNALGALDPQLAVFDAPFLIGSYGHMESVFDGPHGPRLLAGMRAHGLLGLTFTYSGGAQGVAGREREIRGPEDLKGLRVGVFGSEVDKAWLSALGAVPVEVGHDVSGFLDRTRREGLDALVVTWRRMHEARLHEEYRFFSLEGASYLTSVSYINEAFYNGLPEKHRRLVKESALEAGRIERANTITLNERSKREMAAKGVRPVHLSEAGRSAFARALSPVYARALAPRIGEDLVASVRGLSGSPFPKGADELDESRVELSLAWPAANGALAGRPQLTRR